MSQNVFLIRYATIFSSIFRGTRKTLKNCANCTNFANSEIECEEWGEEKNDMRMRSSPPWPMRFEVRFLNFFSMRNEAQWWTEGIRGVNYWIMYFFGFLWAQIDVSYPKHALPISKVKEFPCVHDIFRFSFSVQEFSFIFKSVFFLKIILNNDSSII